MPAEALWRSCCRQGTVGTEDCRQGRCSEEPSGRRCRQGRCSEEPSGRCCWQGRRSGRDTAGRGRRRRPWKAGTATSTSKESNLPEGSTIGKQARKEPLLQARKKLPLQAGKEHPALQANKKESGKTHSLKPALVMTALVRVTGARPRGSSQLLLCSLELLW